MAFSARKSDVMKKSLHKDTLDEKIYFHLYNFGVDKRVIFNDQEDYDRFEAYLYLLNAVESARAANFFVPGREENIFNSARGELLISIGAFSISSHDFHLIVSPEAESGIPKFMQKLQTAYTMYFNRKYPREGSLFQSAYRSEDIHSDDELKYFFAYVHLRPAQILSGYMEPSALQFEELISVARNYRYSSINEYTTEKFVITSPRTFPKYFRTANPHTRLYSWFNKKNRLPA